ncbi:hypothetical protein LshimejAT787_1502200 [Lyophyllum shimeji]|uniref:Uncharacterized protein n=1 Tax=Lyophyllum shimeji TaxID=47721 RepID=A0A9P3UVD1_LYOSH|nr:hypothetical protein LshimejAT787_1502200 [Lyophyllum shimeji]
MVAERTITPCFASVPIPFSSSNSKKELQQIVFDALPDERKTSIRREDIIITSDAYRSIDTSPMSSPPPLPPSLYGVIAGGGSTRNTSSADLLELLEAKEEVVVSQRTWIEDLEMTAVQHSEEIKSYREVFKVQEEVMMVQSARFEALEGKFEAQGEQIKELSGEVAELKAVNAEQAETIRQQAETIRQQAETIRQQSARVDALLGVVGDHKHQIADLKNRMRESDEWVNKRQKVIDDLSAIVTSRGDALTTLQEKHDDLAQKFAQQVEWGKRLENDHDLLRREVDLHDHIVLRNLVDQAQQRLAAAAGLQASADDASASLTWRVHLRDAKDDEERLGVARKLVAAGPDGEESKAALELLESGARYFVVQHPSSIRKAGDGVAHGPLSHVQLHRIIERRSDEEQARIVILTDFVCRAK